MRRSIDLSIIIVSWNTCEILRDCLESLYSTKSGLNVEVIVVDNASKDRSVTMVKDKFAEVRLLVNDRNVGFAVANNQGILLARGRYVLLLNSDTIVTAGALDTTLRLMDQYEASAALPKVLNSDGSVQHPCYVGYPSILSELSIAPLWGRLIFHRYLPGRFELPGDENMEIAHATGAALFIRRNVLQEIGSLDDNLVFSYEDVDICRRIRRWGGHVWYFPAASIVHLGGASRKKLTDSGLNAMLMSKYRYFRKYHSILYIGALGTIIILRSFWEFFFHMIRYPFFTGELREQRKYRLDESWRVIKWHFTPIEKKLKLVKNLR